MYLAAKPLCIILLSLTVTLTTVCYQEVSSVHMPVRVTRSAVESLRDHGTYIINFKGHVTEEKLNNFVTTLTAKSGKEGNFSVEIIQKLFTIKCLTARLSRKALNWVAHHKAVLNITENQYIMFASSFDSTSDAPAYWHLDRLDQELLPLDKEFAVNFTGENVDVYVLDTGIHYEHEDFDGRAQYPGCDPIDKLYHQNRTGRDCDGHGTHVAGLVGGNGTGVAIGVTLFSVRILDCKRQGSIASLIQGLMCVVNHTRSRNGTRAIINLSIAGLKTTFEINNALKSALDNDIIIISSAGNGRGTPNDPFKSINYDSCKVYPAGYPGVINVGATDVRDYAVMGVFDNRTRITNMGRCLDVFAPGYKIVSSYLCKVGPCDDDNNEECIAGQLYNNTCRRLRSGTSQSAPLVAGSIALLLEKCPRLTNAEVKYELKHSLSVNKVMFYEALKYAASIKLSPVNSVVATVLATDDHLLYIGNDLENVNCTTQHEL